MKPATILLVVLCALPLACKSTQDRSRFSFQGNQEIGDGSLASAAIDRLDALEERGYQPAAADDAAFEVEEYYHSRGFSAATVGFRIEGPEDQPRVVFEIEEGVRTLVREVKVHGCELFSPEQAVSLLKAPRSGVFRTGARLYRKGDLDALEDDLRSIYRRQGFLRPEITAEDPVFSEDRTEVDLAVRIVEGPRSIIQSIAIQGEEKLPKERLDQAVASLIGEPFFPRRTFEVEARLEDAYAQEGYIDCEVEIAQPGPGVPEDIHLVARIQEGPRVRIGKIEIHGLEDTKQSFVEHRLHLEEGQVFRLEDEYKSFKRLFSTGLFESIRMNFKESDAEEDQEEQVRDLVVDIKEGLSIEVAPGLGYGSYEQLRASVEVKERNVLGTGRILTTRAQISQKGGMASVAFTDPWFLDSEWSLTVPVRYLHREEPSFTRQEVGTGVALYRRWTKNLSTEVGYDLRYTTNEQFDVDVIRPVENALDDDAVIASIALSLMHDTRNDLFNPTEGHRALARLTVSDEALGGDLSFFKYEVGIAQFWHVLPKVILGFNARTVWIEPTGSTDVIPIQERLFNGGESSVRSFKEQELGPTDAFGNPVGGEVTNLFSTELRYQFTPTVQAALFFDTGNTALENKDYSRDFSSAVGVGGRYLLPIGAVRLDFAVNPNPTRDEDDWNVHFSVGMAF